MYKRCVLNVLLLDSRTWNKKWLKHFKENKTKRVEAIANDVEKRDWIQ